MTAFHVCPCSRNCTLHNPVRAKSEFTVVHNYERPIVGGTQTWRSPYNFCVLRIVARILLVCFTLRVHYKQTIFTRVLGTCVQCTGILVGCVSFLWAFSSHKLASCAKSLLSGVSCSRFYKSDAAYFSCMSAVLLHKAGGYGVEEHYMGCTK